MVNWIIYKIRKVLFKYRWRQNNKQNQTVPASIFPMNLVKVGKMSYGELNVKYYGNPFENLEIGNFVSIAENVTFLLGGNHQTKTFTNYPLLSKLIKLSPEIDSLSKGPIVLEDEVWVGFGAIILSGVRIGKGAVVAAGSVVTKDIPAYAIVGGNPATTLKYRFDEKTRQALTDFNISDFENFEIIQNIEMLYDNVDIALIEKIKSLSCKQSS
jgi:virginiamycin A acetyltransferase